MDDEDKYRPKLWQAIVLSVALTAAICIIFDYFVGFEWVASLIK